MTNTIRVDTAIYRLVEAQEPDEKEFALTPEQITDRVALLGDESTKVLSKYGVQHDKVYIIGPFAEEEDAGLFLETNVSYDGLSSSPTQLFFDWTLDFLSDIRNKRWQNIVKVFNKNPALGMVHLVLCGENFGAADPDSLEGLLSAVATLQKAEQRALSFEPLDEMEQNELVLKDWLVGLAEMMLEHGVGKEFYSLASDLDQRIADDATYQINQIKKKAPDGAKDLISTITQASNLARGFIKDATDRGTEVFDTHTFVKELKGNPQLKKLDKDYSTKVLGLLKKVEKRPANYFQRGEFKKLIDKLAEVDTLSSQDAKNAEKALNLYKNDAEWEDTLKERFAEREEGVGLPEEAIRKHIDKLTQSVGGYKGPLNTQYGEDNRVMVEIQAPAPFMYVFKRKPHQELEFEGASMQLIGCNRSYSVDTEEDAANLLLADLDLAHAKKAIAGYDPKKGKGSSQEEMAKKMVQLIEESVAKGKAEE